MRIATPVCALARNDMLKTERFLRVKCAVFMMKNVLANVDALQVIACHCEERSDVAIRFSCSAALQKVVPKANSQRFTYSPEPQKFGRPSRRDADCHASVRTGSQ